MEKKELKIEYLDLEFSELSDADKDLIRLATEAANDAYAPYSGFRVGAAILLDSGNILSGSNQENAAYPSGLCAERVALFYANAKYPNAAVDTIAITVVDKNGERIDQSISPCGSCRQVISETEYRFNKNIRILLASKEKAMIFNSISQLLPFRFLPDSL